MEKRTQFTMYESIYVSLQRIKKKQDRADAYDAICAYALYQKEPDLDRLSDAASIAFELIRPVLDSARKKAANGKQGGSKRKQTGSKPEANASEKESEEEKENEIEIEIEGEKEKEQTNSGTLFTAFWSAYPKRGAVDRERAWEAWKKLNPDVQQAVEILSCLEAWKKCRRWVQNNGEYIPNAENFLGTGKYLGKYPEPMEVTGGAVIPSMKPGAAEIEAVQRVLREG